MIIIRVIGTPGPQGSKRFMGTRGGKGILVESSKKVKPWREAVKWATREAMEGGELAIGRHCNGGMPGPVQVTMTFTMPKPKSAPKTRRTFPDRKPDIDKLCRSTLDALVSAGAIEDDARVIWLSAVKVFPGEGQDCLDVPGAIIRIRGISA